MLVGMKSPEEAKMQQGGQPRVIAAKSSESRKKSSEHFKWTHLEQVQHCTDLPRLVTFPAHNEQGKTGKG